MSGKAYVILTPDGRICSRFSTNAVPPKDAVEITEEVSRGIPGDLYAGDEPRLRLKGNEVEEIYPPSPGEDYDWDKDKKKWQMRPEPPDLQAEIEELKNRLSAIEGKK